MKDLDYEEMVRGNLGIKSKIPVQELALMAFQPRLLVAMDISHRSQEISKYLPALKYSFSDIHSVLLTTSKEDVVKLMEVASEVNVDEPIEIFYNEWLYNQNSAIIAGKITETYTTLVHNLVQKAKEKGVKVKALWGGNITASRFKKPSPHLERREIKHLESIISEAPAPGFLSFSQVSIGVSQITPDSYNFKVQEKISLI